jgi:hypothetical protein
MPQGIEEEASEAIPELGRPPVTYHPEDTALVAENEICDGHELHEGSAGLAEFVRARCPVAGETLVVARRRFATQFRMRVREEPWVAGSGEFDKWTGFGAFVRQASFYNNAMAARNMMPSMKSTSELTFAKSLRASVCELTGMYVTSTCLPHATSCMSSCVVIPNVPKDPALPKNRSAFSVGEACTTAPLPKTVSTLDTVRSKYPYRKDELSAAVPANAPPAMMPGNSGTTFGMRS